GAGARLPGETRDCGTGCRRDEAPHAAAPDGDTAVARTSACRHDLARRDGPPPARDRLDRGGRQLRAVVDRRTQPSAARAVAPAGGARACARLRPRAPARARSSWRRPRVGLDRRHLGGRARLRGADSRFSTPALDVHRGGAIAGAVSAIRATSNAACGLAMRRALAFSASSFWASLNKAPSFIGSVTMLLILMAAPLPSR